MAEVAGVPFQEFLQPRKRDESVHRDVGAIVRQEQPAKLLGEPEDLRGAEELAQEQPADEGLGMHVGHALIVTVEIVRRLQVVLAALGRALVVDLQPVIAVRVGRTVHEIADTENEVRR